MSDSADIQLQLKKRARRRLVGAIALAGLAAVVLPMVMDEAPSRQVQSVQIRIPDQDQPPLMPRVEPVAEPVDEAVPVDSPPVATVPESQPSGSAPVAEKPVATPPVPKPPENSQPKPQEKPAVPPAEKSDAEAEARRVEAILSGKPEVVAAVETKQQFVILIGAYADPANVTNLQKKLGEMSIKVYTEPLESPQGIKTRVRAGPFPTRDAAEKALNRMKRIGVDGIIAAKS